MGAAAVLLVLLVLLEGSHTGARPKSRFTRYPSWNSKMYPVWKEGDPRYKDSWKGGRVSFNVGNDSPTLSGAKVTFTIDLEFPHSQEVKPGGTVVWSGDCLVNGTQYFESEPVYPQNRDWEAVFPDGTPIKKDKKPAYVFVWRSWGRYWQVADGPSSSLTVDTEDVPLGSYTMDIVIYHYRSKEKFIPLGYASTQFSVTDQIPFAVSLDQVNDAVAQDMRFVQNRAIAFTVTLHDPSKYLSSADITFNWDFGDGSGALISREPTVTHTYISSGSYRPQVVIQAVIPDLACDLQDPTSSPGPLAHPAPTLTAPSQVFVNVLQSDAEEENSEGEASTTSSTPSMMRLVHQLPAAGDSGSRTVGGPKTAVPLTRGAAAAERDAADDTCVIYRYGSFCTAIQVFEGIEKLEIVQMDNTVLATPTTLTNVVDITVTCQGSLPKEVCSVILDADCLKPLHTACNVVEPSEECQLVLRHLFNDSGIYCINVSMSNDVSLAATSAKVKVDMDSGLPSSGHVVMVLSFLVLVLAVGIVGYSYKRLRSQQPVKEDMAASEGHQLSRAHSCSGASMFWTSVSKRGAADIRPLLQD